MPSPRIRVLNAQLIGPEPPTEFRLFAAGVNETTKGPIVFDDAAAAAVMAAWESYGNDLMVDLEHASLDPAARMHRTDTSDARGWFRLEVRNGELWAVNVTWTPDGEERIRSRKQRYTSPAFLADDDGRVTRIVNVAITSMPATHDALPLVASVHAQAKVEPHTRIKVLATAAIACSLTNMDPEKIKAALDALKAEDGAKALAILEELIAGAAGGDPAPSDDAPAPEPLAAAPAPASEEDDAEEMTALSALLAMTGKKTVGEAVHVLSTAVQRAESLDRERAALDLATRRDLIADLVKLNVETPATAWEGDASKRVPVKRLADESLESLRARVEHNKRNRPAVLRAPDSDLDAVSVADEVKTLSVEKLAAIKRKGMTPEQFIEARRNAVRTFA